MERVGDAAPPKAHRVWWGMVWYVVYGSFWYVVGLFAISADGSFWYVDGSFWYVDGSFWYVLGCDGVR